MLNKYAKFLFLVPFSLLFSCSMDKDFRGDVTGSSPTFVGEFIEVIDGKCPNRVSLFPDGSYSAIWREISFDKKGKTHSASHLYSNTYKIVPGAEDYILYLEDKDNNPYGVIGLILRNNYSVLEQHSVLLFKESNVPVTYQWEDYSDDCNLVD